MPDNTSGLDHLFAIPKKDDTKGLDAFVGEASPLKTSIKESFGLPTTNYSEFGDYDQFVTPESDQESIRSTYQGTGSEIANGLGRAAKNLIPSIIGNVASIADVEDYINQDDEVGNDITRWAESLKQENKEEYPIYGENQLKPLDIGESEWWTSNGSSLVESAASFAATGYGLGMATKGLGLLSKIAGAGSTIQKAVQGAGGLGTAVALNQAEAVQSAIGVYDQTYKLQLEKGVSEQEAKQTAADAAAYTININRLNLPLNITSSLAFIRPTQLTRQLVEKAGLQSALTRLGTEGAQEFGEEIINQVAEQEGRRLGVAGKDYKYDADNTIKDVFSKEGLEAGLLGFIGGVAQTGATEAVNHLTGSYREQNELYNKQQQSLNQLDLLSKSVAGQKDIKDILTNVRDQSALINEIGEAQTSNNQLKVDYLKNELLTNQAVDAFESGTTDKLESIYDSIASTPSEEGVEKYGEDYKKSALEAKSQIKELEKEWNRTMQTIPDNYNKKEIFKNKTQQKYLSDQINTLRKQESLLTSEVQEIKLNSEEGVTIPQELELQTISKNIVNLQKQLVKTQIDGNQYLKPIESKAPVKTPQQKSEEFRASNPQNVERTEQTEESRTGVEDSISERTTTPSINPQSIQNDRDLGERGLDVVALEDLPNVSFTDELKDLHDIFSGKKKGAVNKYVNTEEWSNIANKNKATGRLISLLKKKGIDPNQFNLSSIETLFTQAGEEDYFVKNIDSIRDMISAINVHSGVNTPLSYDENIPPTQAQDSEELAEDTGLKRTTSLNSRYKVVKTNEQGYTLKELNGVETPDGNVQFENNDKTPYYDKLHTNEVKVGQELLLELENPDSSGNLDDLRIRVSDKNTGELRFYVSTIGSVNEDSLDLTPEELELERQKITAIRQYFQDNPYSKMESSITGSSIGKLEFNGNAKSISKIPNVNRYLFVKVGAKLVGQNTSDWIYNSPKPEWLSDISSGSVLLALPEAAHTGDNDYYSRPLTITVGTFNTNNNPSRELQSIREEIKQELTSYLTTGKYNSKNLDKWVYVQSNTTDPARLKRNGIQLNNGAIIYNNRSITDPNEIDSILDGLRVNVNSKELSNLNSDYSTRLINSGLLQTKLAFKQIGNDTIFAFHPNFIYSQPVPQVQTEETQITTSFLKEETGIDGEFDPNDPVFFDIEVTPDANFNIDPYFTLNQEDKLINSFAFELLNGKTKEGIKAYLNKGLELMKATVNRTPNVIKRQEIFEKTLESIDQYLDKSTSLLQSLNFEEDELGFTNEFIEVENSLDQMVEEAGFVESRVDSIPEQVRKFLMYIPAYNENNELKRNVLGLLTFNPIDSLYLKIANYLALETYDNTKASYNQMTSLLQQHPDPSIKHVATELDKIDNEQLRNQFFRAFNQQRIESSTFLLNEKKDGGFSVRVARADKSSAYFQLKDDWYINFKNRFIIDKTIDTEKGKKLLSRFNDLINHPSSFKDVKNGEVINQMNSISKGILREILQELGITISNRGLESWLTNDKNYSASKTRADKDHLKNTLLYVFNRLAGNSKDTVKVNDDEVTSVNNPFENEARHIESLAKHESSFSNIQGGASFRHDGKQYSSLVRHMPLESQLENMKKIKNKLLDLPVFKSSFYIQVIEKVNFIVERGFRINKKDSKIKNFKDANEKEHEVIKLLAFQTKGLFKSDTLSDKTTNVFFDVPLVDVIYNDKGFVHGDVRRHLQRYFQMEYDRVLSVKNRIGVQDTIDKFDSTLDRKGAGEYFLTYEFLNYEFLGDTPDEQLIKNNLYTSEGRIEDLSQFSDELRSAINNAVNRLIMSRVQRLTEKVAEDWLKLDIYSVTDKGVKINDFDVQYKDKIAKKLQASNLKVNEQSILDLSILDYVVNYMTQTVELQWLYGDPALQSKISYPKNVNTLTKEQLVQGIKKTFENVGKRNASLMAQSEGGAWSRPEYNIAFINDINVSAEDLEKYPEEFRDAYRDLKNEKMTDAQEFTTVQEHLEDRFSMGEISRNLFYNGMMYFDPQEFKSERFTKLYPNKSSFRELSDQEVKQLNGVLQPRKPVQVFNKFNKEGLQIKYYIKTSSIPLVPSVIKGTPMEKVLSKMKSNNVQRIAFNSGVKIGLGQSQNLFEGNEVNPNLFKQGVHTLERKGYGIQLSVPYDESKDEIRQVTQAMKLLFVDLDDNLKLSNGMTVEEARKRYREIESKMVSQSKSALNKELNAPSGIIVDQTKLSEILTKEGTDRGYTNNTLAGLKTTEGKFNIPLTYSPNIGQIQPVLNSLVNNRIVRQKIKGKSYVQSSEILRFKPKGFEDLNQSQKDAIIWTKPEYKNQSKLEFLSRDGKPAQILAPSFFIKDDKKIDLPLTEDGYLDTTKVDPQLLEMHGFRIPNQAHSSMMHFEVVGFLPEGMGDTVIVPSEIAIQMGSDYDVDKLYAYNYNFKIEDDRISKIVGIPIKSEKQEPITKNLINKLYHQYSSYSGSRAKTINLLGELFSPDVDEDFIKRTLNQIVNGTAAFIEDTEQINPELVLDFKRTAATILKKIDYQELDLKTVTSYSINHFTKDELVNELIDIHKAVILTPKLFETVTKPQGFDNIAQAIDDISKLLPQDTEWLGSYNPIYQRKEYFDNAAGKTGVGVASNHNTQHALAQQANLYIKEEGILFKKDNDEYFNEEPETNRVNDFTLDMYGDMLDKNTSAWRLDKKYTFDGQLISQVIAEWQGASVDNAKEKLLGLGGINDHNLNVSLTIARAGFNNDWILAFINQPILKEYYQTIDNLQSVFYDSFESDRRNNAIKNLYRKYGIQEVEKFMTDPIEGYTLGEYRGMISTLSEEDNLKQANVLKAFIRYENIALALNTLQGSINVDVKGLPKNYVEISELFRKQVTTGVIPMASPVTNFPLGNTENFNWTVIGGYIDIPSYAVDLFSQVYDYNTAAYKAVLSKFKYLQKKDELSSDQLNSFYNGLYSFIYTLPSIQERVADGKNVEEYKRSLVLGENTISDRLQTLKTKYPDNFILGRISRVDSDTNVKMVNLNSTFTKTESYDTEMTSAWLEMMISKDSDLKQFGLDLAAYSLYFNNEPYGISNFMKYLPIEYLNTIGFGEKLRQLHSDLEDENYLNNFIQQYYQHNPEYAKSATFITKLKEGVTKDDSSFILDKNNASALVLETDPVLGETYFPYVKVYDQSTSGFTLYRLADDVKSLKYVKLDQLGKPSFNEYTFNNPSVSSLFSDTIPSGVALEVPITKPLFSTRNYFDINGKDIVNPKDLLKNVLTRTSVSGNEQFARLAEQLLDVDISHEVVLGKINHQYSAGLTNSTRMLFDLDKISTRTEESTQRLILHEYIHALTLNKLANPEFKNTNEYKQLNAIWNRWKASLNPKQLVEAEDFKKRVEKYQLSKDTSVFAGIDIDQYKSKYYAYVSLDEFVTQTMTDIEFQKSLAKIKGKETTLWRSFVDTIKKIVNVTTGTLLDEAVEAVINTIQYSTSSQETQQVFDLESSIGDLMKEMTLDQRTKFRELRESGIFTTNCN